MILPWPLCPILAHQIPLQPSWISGPACQVSDCDGASSRHKQGGWPSIGHNVETMLYSCESVVSSPAPPPDSWYAYRPTQDQHLGSFLITFFFFSLILNHTPYSWPPNGYCKLLKLYCPHLLSTTHCFSWLFQGHNYLYVLHYTHLPFFQFYLCPFPDPYSLYTAAPWWLLVEFMFLIAHLIMDFVSGLP